MWSHGKTHRVGCTTHVNIVTAAPFLSMNVRGYIKKLGEEWWSETILISVLVLERESGAVLQQYWIIFTGSQKLLNFAQPILLCLLWTQRRACQSCSPHLHFFSRVSYRDIFSTQVLLCCHVPGCHERALLDTVSRSRCEPHASNPELRSCLATAPKTT